MRKILILSLLLLIHFSYAQLSTLQINNYSNFKIESRFSAVGINGNCNLSLWPGSAFSMQPSQSVTYDKYYYSHLATIPITSWYVRTSATNAAYRINTHISLIPRGVIATTTDWNYIWLRLLDSNNNLADDFTLGSPSDLCIGFQYPTYLQGTNSEAEWFTITSATGVIYTYVQIY